jgi:hypothetical protein
MAPENALLQYGERVAILAKFGTSLAEIMKISLTLRRASEGSIKAIEKP